MLFHARACDFCVILTEFSGDPVCVWGGQVEMEVCVAVTDLWEGERWESFIALTARSYGSPDGDRAAGQMCMW